MFTGAVAWLCLVAGALAGDLAVEAEDLVVPEEGSFFEGGVGSPAIGYDAKSGTWLMVFETPLAATDDCPHGQWALGLARSDDGEDWEVDEDPLLEPRDDTFYACGVAHPALAHDGSNWHLWFRAEQSPSVCDDGTEPDWGCDRRPGVGHLLHKSKGKKPFHAKGATQISEDVALVVDNSGRPDVVEVDGEWIMLLTLPPSVWMAVADDPAGPWTLESEVVDSDDADWMGDKVYNPSLGCVNDPDDPLVVLVGAKEVLSRANVGGALGWGTSSDGAEWDLDEDATEVWTASSMWSHWEAVLLDEGDEAMVFWSTKDRDGIHLSSTVSSWDGEDLVGRSCATW